MKIHTTRNYELFTQDVCNRPIDTPRQVSKQAKIRASMKKYGYLPFPILVRRIGNELRVLDGQNRLRVAQELGLQVQYVETNRDDITIADCAAGQSPWSLADYAGSWAAQGNHDMQSLLDFSADHKLTLQTAASLLHGDGANSSNVNDLVKSGKFRVRSIDYATGAAELVAAVARFVPWAHNKNSVGALARFLKVKEFNSNQFIQKVNAHPGMLRREATQDAFSEMYAELYNHASRSRIPLAFLATEAANARNFACKAPKFASKSSHE
jgi:hypothetical protein